MNTQSESMTMVQKLARGELSVKARLGYVALLLVSSAMTVGLVSLWLTEAFLPLRTHLAFGAMAPRFTGGVAETFQYLSTGEHFESMSRGVIDSRDLVWFASLVIIGLSLAELKLAERLVSRK